MNGWAYIGNGPGSGESLYERQLQKGSLIAVVYLDATGTGTVYVTRSVIFVPPHSE